MPNSELRKWSRLRGAGHGHISSRFDNYLLDEYGEEYSNLPVQEFKHLIGNKGKEKYFKLFNNLIIADYILSKTFNYKSTYKFIWER